jgi:hypothetical protein
VRFEIRKQPELRGTFGLPWRFPIVENRPPSQSLEIARSWLNAAAKLTKGSNLLSTARVKRSCRRNPSIFPDCWSRAAASDRRKTASDSS